MQVTSISIVPPQGAQANPKATPELLASCLAKYSRSNKGLKAIMDSVDWSNPDRSVDAIFRFVDYGHASIGGLTGGIPIVVDGLSMYLAYKLFDLAQKCDGQESSTRYIVMDESSLPSPESIGIPEELHGQWLQTMRQGFATYQYLYAKLDQAAKANPEIVRIPEKVMTLPPDRRQKTIDRLRVNYALDRARYFMPFATKTNAAYILTARDWAQVIRSLEAMELAEAQTLAGLLRQELAKYAPRLIKHAHADPASIAQWQQEAEFQARFIAEAGVNTERIPDEVYVAVEQSLPPFMAQFQTVSQAFTGKQNRYSPVGNRIRRQMVRFAWNNMSIAELRDLNRHRTGYRFAPLTPVGFYLPPEIDAADPQVVEAKLAMQRLVKALAAKAPGIATYGMFLGTQTPFEHSTHGDKFVYEVELRTGMGAHFRYAEHLEAAARKYFELVPEAEASVTIGTAEPE